MATKFTYSKGQSGNSSFHQDPGMYQQPRQVYTQGAYGPTTPQSVLKQYQGGSNNGGGDGSRGKVTTTESESYSGGGGYGGFDYAGMIQSMLAEQRAAAQRAYDVSKGRLDEAWGNTQKALGENLGRALEDLYRNYDYGSGVHRQDAKNAAKQAYINYMLNKRDLNQNLKALGLSGGATESSMAKMLNNYANAKNDINEQLSRNIAELLNNYQNNTSSAEQLYNTQFADANNNYVNQLNQLEQLLANNMMSSYSGSSLTSLANYAQTLADLQNQMNAEAANYTPVQSNYSRNTVSTSMGNDAGESTAYARYKNLYDDLSAQGQTANSIITQLKNAGASRDDIYQLMGV